MPGVAPGLMFSKMPAYVQLEFWASIIVSFQDAAWIRLGFYEQTSLKVLKNRERKWAKITSVYFLLIQSLCLALGQLSSPRWLGDQVPLTFCTATWACSQHTPQKELEVGTRAPSPSVEHGTLCHRPFSRTVTLGDWEVHSCMSPGGKEWTQVTSAMTVNTAFHPYEKLISLKS